MLQCLELFLGCGRFEDSTESLRVVGVCAGDSVKEVGFCHDAKLGGVNLLRSCVESCDTHQQHQLLQEDQLCAFYFTKGLLTFCQVCKRD